MDKEQITFLINNGFSISEVMELEKPITGESIKGEPDKHRVATSTETPEVITEEPKEEQKEEKKTSSDSSETELLKHIETLESQIKSLQEFNLKNAEIESPKEYTADQAIIDFFNEVN